MTPLELLAELEPTAAKLYERHLGVAKEWFPHEYVPWSRGRDFEPGAEWSPDDSDFGPDGWKLPDAVRASLFVNLLTEDNLPYYTRDIHTVFGGDSAYGEWARNWTAEEGRHSIVIRDYLVVTRALDPVALERARMHQVRGGEVPSPHNVFQALAYLSMQELATRIAHRNTGKLINDPAGLEVMNRVGNDENLHYLFYRDLASAALEVTPSDMMLGIEQAVTGFTMPGIGIPNFEQHAREIAKVGIYDLRIHHEQILEPVVMRHWKIADITGLNAQAEQARERVIAHIEKVQRVAARLARSAEPANA